MYLAISYLCFVPDFITNYETMYTQLYSTRNNIFLLYCISSAYHVINRFLNSIDYNQIGSDIYMYVLGSYIKLEFITRNICYCC